MTDSPEFVAATEKKAEDFEATSGDEPLRVDVIATFDLLSSALRVAATVQAGRAMVAAAKSVDSETVSVADAIAAATDPVSLIAKGEHGEFARLCRVGLRQVFALLRPAIPLTLAEQVMTGLDALDHGVLRGPFIPAGRQGYGDLYKYVELAVIVAVEVEYLRTRNGFSSAKARLWATGVADPRTKAHTPLATSIDLTGFVLTPRMVRSLDETGRAVNPNAVAFAGEVGAREAEGRLLPEDEVFLARRKADLQRLNTVYKDDATGKTATLAAHIARMAHASREEVRQIRR